MRRVVRCSGIQVMDRGNFQILPGDYVIPAAEYLSNDNVTDENINQIFGALRNLTKKNVISFAYNFTNEYSL